jgi:hypothetical protein
MEKKIIVFGASGKTGIEICKQLAIAELYHIAYIRKGSEFIEKTPFTEFRFGNVLDKANVEDILKSFQPTDIIISLGSRDLKSSNIRTLGTQNIIDSLISLSLNSKLHVISALGVGESWSQLNWLNKIICKLLIKNAMIDHENQEKVVINSQQKFHIIRPVGLKDGEATGNVLVQTTGYPPYNDIRRSDVANYLTRCLISNYTGFSSICKAK